MSELRLRHNVRLIARQLKEWARRRRELSEALRGWLWKRRRHATSCLPRPASAQWRRRFVYVRGGSLIYDSNPHPHPNPNPDRNPNPKPNPNPNPNPNPHQDVARSVDEDCADLCVG